MLWRPRPPPPLRSSFPCVITYVRRRGEAAEALSTSPSRLDGQRWRCGAGGPSPPPPNALVIPLACPLRARSPPGAAIAFGCHRRGGGVADVRHLIYFCHRGGGGVTRSCGAATWVRRHGKNGCVIPPLLSSPTMAFVNYISIVYSPPPPSFLLFRSLALQQFATKIASASATDHRRSHHIIPGPPVIAR